MSTDIMGLPGMDQQAAMLGCYVHDMIRLPSTSSVCMAVVLSQVMPTIAAAEASQCPSGSVVHGNARRYHAQLDSVCLNLSMFPTSLLT